MKHRIFKTTTLLFSALSLSAFCHATPLLPGDQCNFGDAAVTYDENGNISACPPKQDTGWQAPGFTWIFKDSDSGFRVTSTPMVGKTRVLARFVAMETRSPLGSDPSNRFYDALPTDVMTIELDGFNLKVTYIAPGYNYRQYVHSVNSNDLTNGVLEVDVRHVYVPTTNGFPDPSYLFLNICTKRGLGNCFNFSNYGPGMQFEYFGDKTPQAELGFQIPSGPTEVRYCYLPKAVPYVPSSGYSDSCPAPGAN